MGQIAIYSLTSGKSYNVTITMNVGQLNDPSNTGAGSLDYYLTISTNMPKFDGKAFPTFVVRKLSDVPPNNPLWWDYDSSEDDFLQESSFSESFSSLSESSFHYHTPTSWQVLIEDYCKYFIAWNANNA